MLNPEMTDEDAANAFLSKLMLDTVSSLLIIKVPCTILKRCLVASLSLCDFLTVLKTH